MSFQYLTFPELRLKHGTEKAINDPVSITSNGNREIRRKMNKIERYSWTIPSRNLHQEDVEEVVQFYNTVHGSVDSFLFKDPTMPELIEHRLTPVYASGVATFGLYHSGMHPVMNLSDQAFSPVWDISTSTDIIIKRNGVVQVWQDDYGVQMNIDPSAAPGYSQYPRTTFFGSTNSTVWGMNDVITYTGPIYHTVRFDGVLSYKISAMKKSTQSTSIGDNKVVPTVSALGDIKLVEVFEYSDSAV